MAWNVVKGMCTHRVQTYIFLYKPIHLDEAPGYFRIIEGLG